MAHFTEEAIREQQRQLDNLREQLSRANALFEAQKKQLGITDADIEQVKKEKLSPVLEALMEQSAREAKRAGEAAAASLKAETAPSQPSGFSGRRRRGLSI